ncbi:MAG: FmdB family transcriptional regulator [Spirochaetaceae bacterium]|jgi:putative FmdB family regulatory protein|nr:FmdB family transcriptional regulator [Spirochaetaceae bacterium]
MPTYEYECQTCNHQFEMFQSMNDKPLTDCPQCGGVVRRIVSGGAGVIYKGSGFYSTDSTVKADAQKKKDGAVSCPAKDSKSACAGCPATSGGSG